MTISSDILISLVAIGLQLYCAYALHKTGFAKGYAKGFFDGADKAFKDSEKNLATAIREKIQKQMKENIIEETPISLN